MTDDLQALARFIELLRNSKLNSSTHDMMEYLLYQLNLVMLRDDRLHNKSCGFLCDNAEIEELNLLILAAWSGEIAMEDIEKQIIDKFSMIVARTHSVDEWSELMSISG